MDVTNEELEVDEVGCFDSSGGAGETRGTEGELHVEPTVRDAVTPDTEGGPGVTAVSSDWGSDK